MNTQTNNQFMTRDIHEAAAIFSAGVRFIGLQQGQGFYYFVFEADKANEVSSKYWSGELKADLKKYSDALRTLKDRLYAR